MEELTNFISNHEIALVIFYEDDLTNINPIHAALAKIKLHALEQNIDQEIAIKLYALEDYQELFKSLGLKKQSVIVYVNGKRINHFVQGHKVFNVIDCIKSKL